MHKIALHRCEHCGSSFELPTAPKHSDILTTPKKHIPLEDSTHVTCPTCGHRGLATEREFFGFLGPRGLQILVGVIVLGLIIATVISSL